MLAEEYMLVFMLLSSIVGAERINFSKKYNFNFQSASVPAEVTRNISTAEIPGRYRLC